MKAVKPEEEGASVVCDGDGCYIVRLGQPLRVLRPFHVSRIDRLLSDMGEYGEVRLIKLKGRLRFIQRTESEDA